MGEYRTAQICLNGHVITSDASDPDFLENFCSQCGAQTIMQCASCKAPIRGDYYEYDIIGTIGYDAPKYCCKCGAPYPWTQNAIDAASALIEEIDGLESSEKDVLKSSIPNIMFESSKTELSAVRIAKYLRKAAAPLQEAFKHTLYGIAVEAAKRIIWPV